LNQNPFRNFLRASGSIYYFPRVPGLGLGLGILILSCIAIVLVPSLPIERTVRVKVELRRKENSSKTRSPYSASVSKVAVVNFEEVKKGDLLFALESPLVEAELMGVERELQAGRLRVLSIDGLIQYLLDKIPPRFPGENAREFEPLYYSLRAQEDFLRHRIVIAENELHLVQALPAPLQNRSDLELKPREIVSLQKELAGWIIDTLSSWEQERSRVIENILELELQYQILSQELDSHQVRAAVDGQVTFLRELQMKDFLAQGEAVLEILAISEPQTKLVISIPSKELSRVKPGMPLRVQFYSLQPRNWGFGLGKITAVSAKAQERQKDEAVYLAEGVLLQWTGNFQTEMAVANLPAELLGEGLVTYATTTLGEYVLDLLQFGYLFSSSRLF